MKDSRNNTVLMCTRSYWFVGYYEWIEWLRWKLMSERYTVSKECIVVYYKSL